MIGIVDIFGGFGNQLFQLSFAKYLSKKNINTYAYVEKSLISDDNKSMNKKEI